MRVLNLIVLVISILVINSCSRLKTSSTQYKIDSELNRVFKTDMPGVAIIATKDGETVYRNSYGLANVELDVKMEPDMCFKIASISKQFTAVAILMLEEQGKLSLDDPITKFLPDYPLEYKDVKIEHLLSHTSGIKNYNGLSEFKNRIKEPSTLKELSGHFINKPFDFSPGDRWKYSAPAMFGRAVYFSC